jgi:hypothetical protein
MPAKMHRADADLMPGVVVSLAPDLAGLQAPDGSMLPTASLGPGIVQQVEQDGRVCVHWVEAGFDSWVDPGDVSSPGRDAHLVSLYRRAKDGPPKLQRHLVITGAGLEHNWTVELWPSHVVRVIRNSDGAAWTFNFNWLLNRIEVWWPQPPGDDDAEALVAAEAATGDRR